MPSGKPFGRIWRGELLEVRHAVASHNPSRADRIVLRIIGILSQFAEDLRNCWLSEISQQSLGRGHMRNATTSRSDSTES